MPKLMENSQVVLRSKVATDAHSKKKKNLKQQLNISTDGKKRMN